ncbi:MULTISPECIES: hypothetical protein [Olivibacter]|uniref:HTH cro/C1-type domain-containing protein n=1 Tax=Olivibacter jilunii TaxID=985016 RepID=A0ABW6AZM4_9SPHI
MANLNKELIKKNIFKLLDYSGLTDISFANLLDISDKQIKRIKKGEAEFSIDDINKACDFFKKTLASINSKEVEIDRKFRDKLIVQHKGNIEYSKLLQERPSITYAINFELLDNESFKTNGLDVSDISQVFEERGWEYSSSYISLAMSRNAEEIERIPHPTNKRRYAYKKRSKK